MKLFRMTGGKLILIAGVIWAMSGIAWGSICDNPTSCSVTCSNGTCSIHCTPPGCANCYCDCLNHTICVFNA